jgi:putative membrane protein
VGLLVKIVVAVLINAAALWVADALLAGVEIDGIGPLLIAGAVLGVLSAIVKPILVLLSLPFLILTLGLFMLVINIVILWMTSALVGGFDISGFWTYVGAVLIVWIVNTVLDAVLDRSGLEV